MTIESIREYLRNKIDNSWYYNARIDYGVSGRFLDIEEQGDDLRVTWEEDGKRYALVLSWWQEYTAEQLYNIWMEADDAEELPEEPDGKKGWDIPSITESLAADVKAGKMTLHDAAVELYRANRIKSVDVDKAAELLGVPPTDPQPTEAPAPEQATEPEPTGTQSIKFFWNGIKINGGKKLIRCHYSVDNSIAVSGPCVTIYARDYSGELPGDLFAVRNDTDSYQDYFDKDKATLEPGHPLYSYARAAALKAAIRELEKYPGYSAVERTTRAQKLEQYRAELATLPAGQPTAADVEAVHALNLAAETARIEAEKEREQKEREAVLCARSDGRHYIEEIAAAHPIREGAPVVTIQWSEHPAFYYWEDGELKLSVAAAEIVLRHFDEERAQKNAAEGRGGYDKTSFVIEYTADDGERHTYEGRYDLGDNDGGLIAHIRAFAESYRDKRLPYHSEEDAAQISAIADLLEAHTAAGRVVSVSLAPWFEKAVRERQKAAEAEKREEVQNIMDAVEMLTDDQLAAAVLHVPFDDPEKMDVARFFLQALARRDEKKALSVFRMWKSGEGLEGI